MAVLLLLLMAAASWQCSSAATYTVGNALGWTVPPISTVYSEWASDKTFVVGDILVFNFVNERHDVTEVTKGSYNSCNGSNPISVETKSPARITLASTGDHHFMCSFLSHCNDGQKLSITVRATSSSAPSPSPSLTAGLTAPPPSIATPPSDNVPSTLSPTTAPSPPSTATSLRASTFSTSILAVVVALVY
ncbi:stellacyanin-like [Cucurbita moschata]|uniref:Stellacyanin-like n=1 Tax=Cucurbita moschata TaxID=3662 RepID=A0A6J1G4T5_CUCMO|nr:stellacyanin-like [Cucurbita moschata]